MGSEGSLIFIGASVVLCFGAIHLKKEKVRTNLQGDKAGTYMIPLSTHLAVPTYSTHESPSNTVASVYESASGFEYDAQ